MSSNDNNTEALNIIRDSYDKLMGRAFFYYNIASQFALKSTPKEQCATMGVGYVDGVHWLVYNPDFIKYYNYEEISVILEHEISHFTYDHVKHFDSSTNARKIFKNDQEAADHVKQQAEQKLMHRLKNICTDRSINIHLVGLPNIRMSLADIKTEFTKEGEFDQAGFDAHITQAFAKKDLWFKDSNMTMSLADDNTILESHCITEYSFKKTLKESGFQPSPELKQLWTEMEALKTEIKTETEAGNQPKVDSLTKDLELKHQDFQSKQDEILFPPANLSEARRNYAKQFEVKKYGTWEYYLDLLLSCPKTEEAIQNIRDMDVHFGDEDGDGEGGRQAQEAREKIIIEGAKNSNAHEIPGDLRAYIKSLFEKHSKEEALPWNVIFRRMINAAKKSIKKNDVNSRNKYAPGSQILPGYILDPLKSVAIIWDVSGSCMDEETQTIFIKECNAMIKAGTQVRVYYTDTEVEHIQDCKDRMMKPSEYQVTGSGGTHLDNGIKRAIQDGYRVIVQLSDNYMDFKMTKKDLKGRRIINVSTTEAKQPSHYGVQIHINRK